MKVGMNDTTLLYYQKNAAAFAEGTLQADMQDAQERFLKHLPLQGYILDFGCGSGRDTKVFLEKGYRVDFMMITVMRDSKWKTEQDSDCYTQRFAIRNNIGNYSEPPPCTSQKLILNQFYKEISFCSV